ncbi:hypothetical protein [Alteromonas sp. a30]|uniref:hypothetical protein n=1 Tax=Alteromonas sp. a30 TaxID=2730917 RepID=UPI002281687F|nr:hypothetical protein [Alteromonas sp. a30]MCY7294176.1 hypothetical protein [Alteromonas sp. a30]
MNKKLNTQKRKVLSFALFLFISNGCANSMTQTPPLGCNMQLVTASANALNIEFTLTNNTDKTLKVLPWGTAWEGWFNRFLDVSLNKEKVEYQGPMMKRGSPNVADFKILATKASWKATLNLRDVYAINSGDLTLQYKGAVTYVENDINAPQLAFLDCALNIQI